MTATSAPKQQRISQPVAAAHHHSRDRIKQALQPISAVRAVATVAAAEAAVSAAAAALVPSKAPEPEPARQSSGPGHKAQPHPQQPKSRPRTHTLNASTPGAAGALQIAGTHAGPCRSSSMRRATAEVAAGCASSSSGSMQASVRASLTGTLQATHPNSAATQAPAQGPAPDEEVALLPLIYPTGSAGLQQPSAAAQLAAYGLTKRIRAQLRSAHGPPAFQRSAPPPRPASPPPVVLDGGLVCRLPAVIIIPAVTTIQLCFLTGTADVAVDYITLEVAASIMLLLLQAACCWTATQMHAAQQQ